MSRPLRPLVVLAMALLALMVGPGAQETSAKAPALATTVLPAEVRAEPAHDAPVLAVVPGGVEIELTGEAAPGFLAVYYDGQSVWVPAQYLSLGVQPGIDTAVAVQNTPLLDAPMRDASVLETILEGQALILTGATVDGYDAASPDGTGGWVDGRDLAQ